MKNQELAEELERLQAKLRRRDLLVPDFSRYEFYDRRVPADVYDGPTLAKWLNSEPHALSMTRADLLRHGLGELGEEQFPDVLSIRRLELPLDYRYEPGSEQDGVTLDVPIEALNQLAPEPLGWLVPGLMKEKVLALIRALPKSLRTRFVPAPETAERVVPMLRFGEGDIHAAVAAALGHLGGIVVPPDAFQDDRLPPELRMNVRVTAADGRLLAAGRDLEAIRRELGSQPADSFSQLDDPRWNRDGLTDWDFDDLPPEVELPRGRIAIKAYPALLDRPGDCPDFRVSENGTVPFSGKQGTVSLRLVDSLPRAEYETRLGLRRLCLLAAHRELKTQVDWLPNLDRMEVYAATLPGFDVRRQLVELLADRAMVADQPLPRSREDYNRLLAAGRERIGWAAQEVLAVVWPLFEGYQQACLALEEFDSRSTPKPPAVSQSCVGGDSRRRLHAQDLRNRRRESPPTDSLPLPRAGNTRWTTPASKSRG